MYHMHSMNDDTIHRRDLLVYSTNSFHPPDGVTEESLPFLCPREKTKMDEMLQSCDVERHD